MKQVNQSEVDICLIVPPFSLAKAPALGVSLLASECIERALKVKVIYANLMLAARIGYDLHHEICNSRLKLMFSEITFLKYVYPNIDLNAKFISNLLSPDQIVLVDNVSSQLGDIISECVIRLMELRPKIVGLSSTYQQHLAAVALAGAIRKADPDICIVAGGANMGSPMGEALMHAFHCFDYVFSGEADKEFPDFCESYLSHRVEKENWLIECQPLSDMTQAHVPDFSDYYEALGELQRAGKLPWELPLYLPLETSRGCWWGERHHCAFCGFNADGIKYRRKSADQILSEVEKLVEKWAPSRIHVADNIMSMSFFEDVLPRLESLPDGPNILFEVKANINENQLDQMVRSGIDGVQPGIESLSSSILKLMRKGTTAIQNILLLRNCKSRGMVVLWNFLYKVPGECANAYEDILRLIPSIEHLHPPSGFYKIIISRYSPYFNNPEEFGISRITPWKSYSDIYPTGSNLNDLAYYFDGEYSTELLDDKALLHRLEQAIESWKIMWVDKDRPPRLRVIEPSAEMFFIVDTRSNAKDKLYRISSSAVDALNYFKNPRKTTEDAGLFDAEIDFLMSRNLVIEYEGFFLSIVT